MYKKVTTKAIAKVAAVATGLGMATSLLSLAPMAHAAALTTSQVDAVINLLTTFGADTTTVANVRASLTGGTTTGGTVGTVASACAFTMDLHTGSSGAQVTCLQNELIAAGYSIPAGATGYFGAQTQAAVAAWQAANGVMPSVGYFGPISQAKWALMMTGSTPSSPLPVGCTSTSGYSPTTGLPCSGATGTTTSPTPADGGPLEGGAGSVDTYTLMSTLNNEDVGEDEEDVQVAGIELEVNEGSDIEVTAVKLDFDQGTANHDFEKDASEVSIWLDGEEVGRVDADKFNDDNAYDATVSLDGAIIRADETGELVVAVSGISNLDSADATDTWTVDVTQVRFVDADGATISEDPGTGARTFSFEDFATATNAVLKLLEDDSDINDARTVEVDATADTDNVDVLSFTLEAEGDSDLEIKNYAVSVTVTGAANTDDVLSGLALWIDGEEVASATTVSSGGLTEDYLFDDVDFTIPAGETVEAVIKADFLSIADALDEGDTIAFAINEDIDHITTRIKVVDEAGDDLVDADMTGSVTSGAFELRSVGIAVAFVSADEEVNVDDGSDDDTGIFTIVVNVEAFGDTVYVASSTQATTASTIAGASIVENLFRLDQNGTATTTLLSDAVSFTTGGGAALSSTVGNITLTENEDTDITFTVSRTNTTGPDNNGLFQMLLKAIGWNTADTWGAYNIYNFNLDDFKTGTASLD